MDITSFLIGKEVGGGSAPTPTYQDKEITITQNGEQTITADSGYDALSSVDITTNVPQPSGKITITQNGTDIDVSSYATADVNVSSGGINDYFYDTISSSNSGYYPGWSSILKDYPDTLSASGNSLEYALAYYNAPKPIPHINNINNVTKFSYAFAGIRRKEKLDLSYLQIDQTGFGNPSISMYYMFYTSQFTEIDLSGIGCIQEPNSNFSQMFYFCGFLEKVDLSNFYITIAGSQGFGDFFGYCNNLREIDMSSFDFTLLNSYYNMFGTTASTGVPDDCLIYVKDQTQVDWFATNFSRLTNVQIKGA